MTGASPAVEQKTLSAGGLLLEVSNLEVVYHDTILALDGVSLGVTEGAVTAVLGSNGAGKSTLLKTVAGILESQEGRISKGRLSYDGKPIPFQAAEIVQQGVRLVPENRGVFADLTVEENLLVGAHTVRDRAQLREGVDLAFTYFPKLADRRKAQAGFLSGGEQQMLAIGMALISRPRLLMLDEPSLGLAPMLVKQIFEVVAELVRNEGVTILLVEQSVGTALELARYGYIMQTGRVVLEGTSKELREHPDVQESYLGTSGEGERRSFRETKTYSKRKRWL